MAVYAVRIEAVPEESEREPGTVVACFEERGEAEYFTTVAAHLRSLHDCTLAVVMLPTLDRPRANGRAA